MRLVITFSQKDDVLSLDLSPDLTLADLKAYIEAESGIPTGSQSLVFNSNPLIGDHRELSTWELQDDDMIVLIDSSTLPQGQPGNPVENGPNATSSPIIDSNTPLNANTGLRTGDLTDGSVPPKLYEDVERVRNQMLRDTVLRRGVEQTYPQLVEAINDPARFRDLLIEIEKERVQAEEARRQELKRLQDDPYNEESQQKILEMIQQEAVMENLNNALEHNPEVFGRVTMLFIDVLVNGHKVKAFVDSGAQATIMSPECVDKCHMSHLIDKRFQGIARGVGTAKILGRIHSAPLKVGDSFLPCSFTIMEGKSVDLLLGLDMLKRHQATIDLKNNVLVIGSSQVPFLSESEIPSFFMEDQENAEDAAATGSGSGSGASQGTSGHVLGGRNSGSGSLSSASGQKKSRLVFPEAQPSPKQAQQSSSNDVLHGPSFSEETIQSLIGLGFSRSQVIAALERAGGNPELAAAILFQ